MNQTVTASLEQGFTARQMLEHHWDNKLAPSAKNPFPLAPKDLVRRGVVNDENYARENLSFGRFCADLMSAQIRAVVGEADPAHRDLRIEVLGAGLCRDLGWIPEAERNGFRTNVREISDVACENVLAAYPQFVGNGSLRLKKGEIEETWSDDEFGVRQNVMYFASQFIQVQTRGKMFKVMKRLGLILARRSRAYPQRRLCLVHPLGKDNGGPREWDGQRIASVAWGDTKPYDEWQLAEAIREECPAFSLETLGRHAYYHQVYSFIKIVGA